MIVWWISQRQEWHAAARDGTHRRWLCVVAESVNRVRPPIVRVIIFLADSAVQQLRPKSRRQVIAASQVRFRAKR